MRASSPSAPSDSVKSINLWELGSPRLPPEPDYWAKKPSFWPKKPSLFARSLKLVRLGLMALGIASIGALAGVGNYYLNGISGVPLLIGESTASPANESAPPPPVVEPLTEHLATAVADEPPAPQIAPAAAPANERLAALLDQPETSANVVPPAILKQVSMFRAPPPREDVQLSAVDEVQILLRDDARLPRARPDEPLYTGSIRDAAPEPQQVAEGKSAKPKRWRRFGPCAALKSLRVPYLFGNRCGRYTRYDPPPPRQDVRVVAAQPVASTPAPARQYSPQPYQPPRVTED